MEGSVEDRISGLPEAILSLILSFLLTQDAVRTAPTCKTLNQVWSTLPFFDLGPDFFSVLPSDTEEEDDGSEADEVQGQEEDENKDNSDSDDDDDGDEEEDEDDMILRKRENLVSFLDQTLMRRREQGLTIHKFRLGQSEPDDELRHYLDRWIHFLVECNIKDLVLQFTSEEYKSCYDLPGILLTASSLFALTLRKCRIPPGSIALSSLQKLHLEFVYLDDQFVKHIVSTCRDLEDLKLVYCPGFKGTIDVSGQSQMMRVLELCPHPEDTVREIVVEAQYLESLSYTGGFRQVKININTNFEGCLKFLHICGANITNEWFCKLISKLLRLKELYLAHLSLKAIEISSSSLKRLSLSSVFDYGGGNTFGEFTINAPNLEHFSYSGCLTPVFLTSLVVKEVVLDIEEVNRKCTPEQLCSKLMQFLHSFDYSEVVTLECSYFEQLIFPLETRTNLVAPLARIKHLILKGKFQTHPIDALPLLFESLQWICPSMHKLSFRNNHFHLEGYPIDLSIEFISKGGTYAEVLSRFKNHDIHYQDQLL